MSLHRIRRAVELFYEVSGQRFGPQNLHQSLPPKVFSSILNHGTKTMASENEVIDLIALQKGANMQQQLRIESQE
jgi:hypothetical protein